MDIKISQGGTSAERSWHERFYLSYDFSREKCSEIFPEMCEPFLCTGQKNSAKFTPKLPPNFPPQNIKKFTDELLQERRAEQEEATRDCVSNTDPGAGNPCLCSLLVTCLCMDSQTEIFGIRLVKSACS